MFNREWTESYIARARKEFKNFEADIHEYDGLTTIDWKNRDGSGNWYVRYILDGIHLIITGDLGSAVFRRYGGYTLAYCRKMINDLFYNAGKCISEDRNSGISVYTWSRSHAKEDLDKLFANYPAESGFSADELREIEDLKADLLASCGPKGIVISNDLYDRLSDIDPDISYDDAIEHCGIQYSPSYIAWLVGLQMIAEQQDQNVMYGPKLKLEVASGKKIVAEINPDPSYKELFVYLEDEQGRASQDLAIIGESYDFSDDSERTIIHRAGEYSVRVYADAYDECYTDRFDITEYQSDEDSFDLTKEFVLLWAKRAWELNDDFAGTISGGISPQKNLLRCEVTGPDTVEIRYDYPETCGLSDVRYHVIEPHKVREDVFTFTKDGQILMNGKPFPRPDQLTDEWTEDEAKTFVREFKAAFEETLRSE